MDDITNNQSSTIISGSGNGTDVLNNQAPTIISNNGPSTNISNDKRTVTISNNTPPQTISNNTEKVNIIIGSQGPSGPPGSQGPAGPAGPPGPNEITNLIEPGSNITFTGTGTLEDPFIVNGQPGGGGVESVTGLNTDNTDTSNPIVKISVDNDTITGQGTPEDPLVAHSTGGTVESVTGLNTDNTDQANPIVKISVDNDTITGEGTPESPLISHTDLSAYVPYSGATQNVDLNNKNLTNIDNFGLNGEIDFNNSVGVIKGQFIALGATTFHGFGKNNLRFNGTFTGTGTPTFTFTITALEAQVVKVDDTSIFTVGDDVTGDGGGIGTVLVIDNSRGGSVTLSVTSSFVGSFSITDVQSDGTANINSVTVSDIGTFTDGTTTITDANLVFPSVINGISYAVTGISNRYRLHTLNNFWTAPITNALSPVIDMNFITGFYAFGDPANIVQGNVITTRLSNGNSVFEFKDKLGTYLSVNTDINESTFSGTPIFTGLTGAGSQFIQASATGQFSRIDSPLSRGAAIGNAINDSVLYTNASGNLDSNSSFTYHNQDGASTFNLAFPASSFGSWININDNNGRIKVGNNTSGYIDANQGFFGMAGQQVNIQSITGNLVMSVSPDTATIQMGDVSSVGFGGIMDFLGQLGDIYFGTITGTRYVDFDMLNGVYTIGNPLGAAPNANSIIVNQATGFTSITELPIFANDAAAIAGSLQPGMLYQNTAAGKTNVCVVP